MTLEEAKRILHPDTSRVAIADIDANNGFNREKGIEKVKEACLMACEALEKQIPKRMANIEIIYGRYGDCPSCDLSYQFTDYGDFNFCPNCGQKIDWN